MNAQELYEEMKNALSFLGLSFHEMDKVIVTIPYPGWIKFTYGNKFVTINVGEI